MKLNIGSYCTVLWSIFGERCDYYCKLLKIYRILDRKECFTIWDAYTKEICARITWAIVDNGRSFLGATPWHPILQRGQGYNSQCCSWNQSQMRCATPSRSNAQPSQRSGQLLHQAHWDKEEGDIKEEGGIKHQGNPLPPCQQTGQIQPPPLHLPSQGGHHQAGLGSREAKMSKTQRSRPSWIHTSRSTIITSIYLLF